MIISLKLSLLLFSLYACNVECKPDYVYREEANAWFKVHKVTAKWKDAFFKCYYEGAVLASPTNEVMLHIITELQGNNDIFIGTQSTFSPGQFLSVEGVNIDNMPMTELIEPINSEEGDCLKMNAKRGYQEYQPSISAVQCGIRLPYICYKNKTADLYLTPCGTFDREYKFEPSTGSCYKFHNKPRVWADANSMCVTEGGYLVVLNNEDEARMIYNSTLFELESMFVGLRSWKENEGRRSEKETWFSIHGEPMQQLFNEWQGSNSYNNNGDCGTITQTGLLQKIDCDQHNYFVCEKDPLNVRFL